MATVEEVCRAMLASNEEQRAFAEALKTEDGFASYLAEHGCEAGPKELVDCLARLQGGELADEELGGVAGGQGVATDASASSENPDCPQCPWCKQYNTRTLYYDYYDADGDSETACLCYCNDCQRGFAIIR